MPVRLVPLTSIGFAFFVFASAALCQQVSSGSRFQALRCPAPSAASTWAILQRDGAGREVEPYLSSLAGGEAGTGKVVSPEFVLAGTSIRFTICGHDGQGGGLNQNFIELVDAESGETLLKTMAPGSDPMRTQSWDTGQLQGRKVRIEVHDGNAEGAFAWLGIGSIDAGAALKVDFRNGLPDDWKRIRTPVASKTETIVDGVPFMREATAYTVVPEDGAVEIPCGFTVERLFFLGCTIARGQPLRRYGTIELLYESGMRQEIPLIYGFTLDGEGKLLSPSPALYLHPSGDRFQHYLVIQPRKERLQLIRLNREPSSEYVPRITAVTCQTLETAATLAELPESKLTTDEENWMRAHTLPVAPDGWPEIEAQIRRDHRL